MEEGAKKAVPAAPPSPPPPDFSKPANNFTGTKTEDQPASELFLYTFIHSSTHSSLG